MVHRPKRSSVFGVRKLGDLTDREAPRKAIGNQNLTPGRYDVNEEAKKGTQKSLSKIKAGKAETGGTETPVIINPEKPDAIGKTYN